MKTTPSPEIKPLHRTDIRKRMQEESIKQEKDDNMRIDIIAYLMLRRQLKYSHIQFLLNDANIDIDVPFF